MAPGPVDEPCPFKGEPLPEKINKDGFGRGKQVTFVVYSVSQVSSQYKTNTFHLSKEAEFCLAEAAAQLLLLH